MGRPQSKATRAKISASLKKQHAAGTRPKVFGGNSEAIAEFNRTRKQTLGTHRSEEANKKTSLTLTGRKFTEERKQKLRKPSAKKSAAKKGIPRSPETNAKVSAGVKAYYASLTPEEQGAFNEKRMKAVRTKNTDLEAFVAYQLDKEGIAYEPQQRIKRYVVDFLLPDKTIIEVNGCFWHGCLQCGYDTPDHTKRREFDSKRIAYLEQEGYTVIVLWQHDLLPLMKAKGG